MYEKYFGFNEKPFQMTSNPNYLFPSSAHNDVLQYLNHVVHGNYGLGMLTGESGTGKTTVCRAFIQGVRTNIQSVIITEPKENAVELMQAVNNAYRINANHADINQLMEVFRTFLKFKTKFARKCLLIIDNAHDLDTSVLEQIWQLYVRFGAPKDCLHTILVGRPELRKKLKERQLSPLNEAISKRWHLKPMNLAGTRRCIQHRINVASSTNKVEFCNSAYRLIHRCSGGVPGLINKVCEDLLITAYGESKKKITRSLVIKTLWRLTGKSYNPCLKIFLIYKTMFLWFVPICLLLSFVMVHALTSNKPFKKSASVNQNQAQAKEAEFENAVKRYAIEKEKALQSNSETEDKNTTQLKRFTRLECPPINTNRVKPSKEKKDKSVDLFQSNEVFDELKNTRKKSKVRDDLKEALEMASSIKSKQPRLSLKQKTGGLKTPHLTEEAIKSMNEYLSMPEFLKYVSRIEQKTNRMDAFRCAMRLWHIKVKTIGKLDRITNDIEFFGKYAQEHGLLIHSGMGTLNQLKKTGLPAILEIYHPRQVLPKYLVMKKCDRKKALVGCGKENNDILISLNHLDQLWSGVSHTLNKK